MFLARECLAAADANMKLRRALAINIRVTPKKFEIGDKVHVWREEGVSKAHRGWSMIAKVIGKEKEYTFNNCKISKNFENLSLKKELLEVESMSTYAMGHLVNQICKNL